MQAFLISQLPYAYWWVFFFLLVGGLCLPVSEELIVLCSGFLAYKVGVASYTVKMMFAIWAGALCGDQLSFWMGRMLGPPLLQMRLFRYLYPPARRVQVERWFSRYGSWTLFFGRFLPFGIRTGVIWTAAVSRTRYSTFVAADIPASLLVTTSLFWLGFAFGDNFLQLAKDLRLIYTGLFTILFVMSFGWFIRRWWRKHSHFQQKDDSSPLL